MVLRTGDRCIVVMKETSAAGPHGDIYWLAHGTTLLRATPEHVRHATHPESDESRFMDSLDRAQLAVLGIRNRGVTHYVDLPKSNKRKREEVATEDEAEELNNELADFPTEPQEDRWQASPSGEGLRCGCLTYAGAGIDLVQVSPAA